MGFWYFMKIGNVLIIPQENIYQPNQVLFIIEIHQILTANGDFGAY